MEWNQEGRCCSQLATSSARDFSQAQNWTYTFWVPFFVRISPLRCFPANLLFFVFFFNKIRDCMFTRCSHPCQMQRTCFLAHALSAEDVKRPKSQSRWEHEGQIECFSHPLQNHKGCCSKPEYISNINLKYQRFLKKHKKLLYIKFNSNVALLLASLCHWNFGFRLTPDMQ